MEKSSGILQKIKRLGITLAGPIALSVVLLMNSAAKEQPLANKTTQEQLLVNNATQEQPTDIETIRSIVASMYQKHLAVDLTNAKPNWDNPKYANKHNENTQADVLTNALKLFFANLSTNNELPRVEGEHSSTYYMARQLTSEQIKAHEKFKHVFIESYMKDSASNLMPFNAEYMKKVIDRVTFCFAYSDLNSTSGRAGEYSYPKNAIAVYFHDEDDKYHDTIMLHEIGHALGLGESLSDLLAETFLGGKKSYKDMDDWEYNSSFDRQLLNRVGPEKFWRAVFSGNKAYSNLWNEKIKEISFEETSMIRGIVQKGGGDFKQELKEYFKFDNDVSLEMLIVDTFRDIHKVLDVSTQPVYDDYLHDGKSLARDKKVSFANMRSFVEDMKSFAKIYKTKPIDHLSDAFVYPNEFKVAREKFFAKKPPIYKMQHDDLTK